MTRCLKFSSLMSTLSTERDFTGLFSAFGRAFFGEGFLARTVLGGAPRFRRVCLWFTIAVNSFSNSISGLNVSR